MINLCISPSQQQHNKCFTGDAEQDHCFLIAESIKSRLDLDKRFNVYVIQKLNAGSDVENLLGAIKLSNEWIKQNGGNGYHLSIHTDGGYNGHGASGFYTSEVGKKFGLPIWNEMCALTPTADMSFTQRPGLAELKDTIAVAFLLEVAFHDNVSEANWVHNSIDKIACAIIKGLYKTFGEVEKLDIAEAIALLKDSEVIMSPDYWTRNAVKDGMVLGDYAAKLIINMANYIRRNQNV